MRYFDLNDRSFCSMIMYDNEVVEKKKNLANLQYATIFVRIREKITYFTWKCSIIFISEYFE